MNAAEEPEYTDWQRPIVASLKAGEWFHFGANARNMEVCEFFGDLHERGLVTLTDMELSQETRFRVDWVKP